jgi:hypothetical protein
MNTLLHIWKMVTVTNLHYLLYDTMNRPQVWFTPAGNRKCIMVVITPLEYEQQPWQYHVLDMGHLSYIQ